MKNQEKGAVAKKSRPPRKKEPALISVQPETVLVLRTCTSEMRSHDSFEWPESGPVEAPDWQPTAKCGNGLHGWLWGHGDWRLKAQGDNIRWLVVEVEKSTIIDLDGKVKFPRGNVIATFGHWRDAMAFIRARRPFDPAADQIATGYSGHAAATGNYGHAAATGNYGHAAATGYSGHAAATGNSGHAAATGDYGHAAATGDYGHAAATGDSGWAAAGYGGRAKAGNDGVLTLLWFEQSSKRPRVVIGYVGENGIKGDTWYRASERGELVEEIK
jgi:hypothetical protein